MKVFGKVTEPIRTEIEINEFELIRAIKSFVLERAKITVANPNMDWVIRKGELRTGTMNEAITRDKDLIALFKATEIIEKLRRMKWIFYRL